MKVLSTLYSNGIFIRHSNSDTVDAHNTGLVLAFGQRTLLTGGFYDQLRAEYPSAEIAMASTAGEIYGQEVCDGAIAVTAVEFDNTVVRSACVSISAHDGDSFRAGSALAAMFPFTEDLCYMMLLSDGSSLVNGSELVRGIEAIVQHRVPVTGGMAGDGVHFNTTVVGLNAVPEPGNIMAIAFYSSRLAVTHGTMGGYDVFGPELVVTRSAGTRVYTINHQNAIELYTKYLGPYAAGLPGSAMLFPLAVREEEHQHPVVRTILSIEPDTECMIFAGDIPQGSKVRLMKANFDCLIEAASQAASATLKSLVAPAPRLAFLVSCVGRKIILDRRVGEEIEAVAEVYNSRTILTGFYSYGEICPFPEGTACALHNQTMTITAFDEL